MTERWIVIPRWHDFQHYKNRAPVWLKLYTRLEHDDAFRSLTHHQAGVLLRLWIAYANSDGQLRDNTLTLTRQLGQRTLTRDLEALNHAGFIEFSASKPLAQSKREKKIEIPKAVTSTEDVAAAEPGTNGLGDSQLEDFLTQIGAAHILKEMP